MREEAPGGGGKATTTTTRYWSDEAYAQFYEKSTAERGLVNKKGASGGADHGGLSKKQLEDFQQAFAEWAGGKGAIRGAIDFRRLLQQLGVELSAEQARSLWKSSVPEEGPEQLAYEEALHSYLQVVNHPWKFERGAVTQGVNHVPDDHVFASTEDADEDWRPYHQDVRKARDPFGPGRKSSEGLGFLLGEARTFLLAEGLSSERVEAFLRQFAEAGSVPQEALFNYLTQQAGAGPGADIDEAL